MSQILFQIQSTLIVILMTIGIVKRKQRNIHIPIMITCMVWDVLLILQIQFMRQAVQKASQMMTNHVALNIHVSFAISTVIFYCFMAYTGRQIVAGSSKFIPKHKLLGKITYTLRILTYITSYFAVI